VLTTAGTRAARAASRPYAGLRVVRVHEIGGEVAEQPVQLGHRRGVAVRGHRARRVPERHVPDPHRAQRGDVRAGRGGAEHLVAGIGKGTQLRAEQERERDVGRRDVDDPRRAHRQLTGWPGRTGTG
jgi:hypothetical protein